MAHDFLVMTSIELTGPLIVLIAVAIFVGGGGGDISRLTEFTPGTPLFAVMAGALLAYYSYVGFETSANIVEEIRNPAKVYPRTLFAALLTAGILYMLVAAASTIAVPVEELADSTGPLLTVIEATGTGIPGWLFSAIALIAVANGALLTMIMASRMAYGMAHQGLLPAALGRVLAKRGTPWVAIIVTTIVTIVLTFTGGLAILAGTVVVLLLFVFLSTNIVLGALSCLALMAQQGWDVWLRAGILIAVGAVLFLGSKLWRRQAAGLGGGPTDVVDAAPAPLVLDADVDVDLLIVGGPTHAFSMSTTSTRESAKQQGAAHIPAGGIREWIAAHPSPRRAILVATFDTRVVSPRLPGSAAKKAMKRLVALGYRPIVRPETFGVHGYSGPVAEGELERARRWGAELATLVPAD